MLMDEEYELLRAAEMFAGKILINEKGMTYTPSTVALSWASARGRVRSRMPGE